MPINQESLNLIKSFEGLRLKAYPDPATKAEPYTIGYGTTIYNGVKKVQLGDVITEKQAEAYLLFDVDKFSKGVSKLLQKPLSDNQFGAITSFAYNVGLTNFKSSNLLKKINNNPNDYSIKDEFLRWNRANGKVLMGLTKRRKAESLLYFS